jgi:hypothetical protein
MWQYDPNLGDLVWVEPVSSTPANVPASIASLVPSGGAVQQNMATTTQYDPYQYLQEALKQGFTAEYQMPSSAETGLDPTYQGSAATFGDIRVTPLTEPVYEGYGDAAYQTGSQQTGYIVSRPIENGFFENTVYDNSGNFQRTTITEPADNGFKDLATLAAMALTAGGAGGLLGGALTGGALTGTGASALGNALISGAAGALTGQDPLKAALLAAGGTFAGGLFGGAEAATPSTLTDAQFIAADAAQLAQQGLAAPQIEQVLQASGVNAVAAIGAADAATAGLSVPEIAQEITLGNRGLFTEAVAPEVPPTAPVEVAPVAPEALQTIPVTAPTTVASIADVVAAIPAAVMPQPEIVSAPLPPLDQQVTVTGTQQPTVTLEDILAAVVPAAAPPAVVSQPEVVAAPVAPAPAQAVEVTAPKAPNDNLAEAIAAVVNPVVQAPVAPSAPAEQVVEVPGTKETQNNLEDAIAALVNPVVEAPVVPPANEVVEVTAKKEEPVSVPTTGVSTDLPSEPSGGGVETQDQATRTEKQNAGLSLDDVMNALKAFAALSGTGMFGGGGGGGTSQRPFVAPTATVPQGNEDYYRAIQQYYNTYMPQTPRDVATPLQQWYEGKFGG